MLESEYVEWRRVLNDPTWPEWRAQQILDAAGDCAEAELLRRMLAALERANWERLPESVKETERHEAATACPGECPSAMCRYHQRLRALLLDWEGPLD